jgi:hypothetical protein
MPINIGTEINTGLGSNINIGKSGTTSTTKINGRLMTSVGVIAGKDATIDIDSATLPRTLDTTTTNIDISIVFYNAVNPGTKAFVIPEMPASQKISLTNWCTTFPIRVEFTTNLFYAFGINNGTTGIGVSFFDMPAGFSMCIQKISGKWFQFGASNIFPIGLTTSGNVSNSGNLTTSGVTTCNGGVITPSLSSSSSLSIGTTNTTSVTLGGNTTPVNLNGNTTVNGSLTMGNNIHITLGSPSSYTLPVSGQIGYTYNVPMTNASLFVGDEIYITTITSTVVPPGTYLFFFTCTKEGLADKQHVMGMSKSSGGLDNGKTFTSRPGNISAYLGTDISYGSMTIIIQNTVETTWYLNTRGYPGYYSLKSVTWTYTRIA